MHVGRQRSSLTFVCEFPRGQSRMRQLTLKISLGILQVLSAFCRHGPCLPPGLERVIRPARFPFKFPVKFRRSLQSSLVKCPAKFRASSGGKFWFTEKLFIKASAEVPRHSSQVWQGPPPKSWRKCTACAEWEKGTRVARPTVPGLGLSVIRWAATRVGACWLCGSWS